MNIYPSTINGYYLVSGNYGLLLVPTEQNKPYYELDPETGIATKVEMI